MKINNKIIVVILVVFSFIACKQETKPQLFERLAKEETKRCPIVIEDFIVLDSVVYVTDSNTNKYYYTLSGEFDDVNYIRENKNALHESLTQGVINSTELKYHKEYNVILEYIYFSKLTKQRILDIVVMPKDYN